MMLLKFDSKTGNIIGFLDEQMFKPPGTVGHINVFEDGKRKYKKKDQIRSLMIGGEDSKKVLKLFREKKLHKVKVKKEKEKFKVKFT